jgi:hypothetical protein
MSRANVTYKTILTEITKVVMAGKVVYDPDLECYTCNGESVEGWMERLFEQSPDAYIVVKIEVHDGKPDDSDLVQE